MPPRRAASLHILKQPAQLDIARTVKWDLLIVDEAHYLRNRESQAWQAVNALPRQFLLLLTATPVQNSLEDLYNLVTPLQPGQLPSPKEFRSRFIDPKRPRQPREPEELRRLLGQVMIRDVRKRLIRNLSKGYKQRVGLAQALIGDPPVLILVEPTIGLDPHQIKDIRDLIRDLGTRHTVLLSSHILPEVSMLWSALAIATRVRETGAALACGTSGSRGEMQTCDADVPHHAAGHPRCLLTPRNRCVQVHRSSHLWARTKTFLSPTGC